MADEAIPQAAAPAVSTSTTPEDSRRQLEALLEVSEAIAHHRDLGELFHELAERLHRVVQFDYLNLVLHDRERNVMRLHILEAAEPRGLRPGFEVPFEESPSGWVVEAQQPFVVAEIEAEMRFPRFLEMLRKENVRSFCVVPLTTAQRRLGALGFGRVTPHRYADDEVQFMRRVASQVAVAVDNALNAQSAAAYQQDLARERDRLRLLLEVNNAVVSNLGLRDLFSSITAALSRVLQHEYTSLALFDAATNSMRVLFLDFPGGESLVREEMTAPLDTLPAGRCYTSKKPFLSTRAELERFDSDIARYLLAEGVQSIVCVPLVTRCRTAGTLNLASRRSDAFRPEDVELLSQAAGQVAIAVENALAYKEIETLKNKLAEEKLYLEEEIRSELNFEEIIGESAALKKTLAQVETVAPAGTTVLILGETGTGKELIARAIHNRSPRREGTFVKVNCAAIPAGLLESELFGHERGAFTGAIAQKIGRFELADGGTIFLDEAGDIPLELQPKLLRVLQEQEFERLGGTRTIRVDVRVVAATNADLAQLVAERKFRSDLYYRLNVFPIYAPALRERPGDVALLVRYFVQKYSRRFNKNVLTIPQEALDALAAYSWPGNIRELENLMERAVLLSPGSSLRVPLSELRWSGAPALPGAADAAPLTTLEEAERRHILRALRETRWVIAGPTGAAARLGIKRTTLQSRMRKLGIRRPV